MVRYELMSGTYRRREDGVPVVYRAGDVVDDLSDSDLDAFGDLFREVDDDVPVSQGERRDADRDEQTVDEYVLTYGTHRAVDDGDAVEYVEGDVVELSRREYRALSDKFRPVDESLEGTSDESLEGTSREEPDDSAGSDEGTSDTSDDAEPAGALEVPADFEYALPSEFPDVLPDDYNALRVLATANGIDSRQSKAALRDALEGVRDQG